MRLPANLYGCVVLLPDEHHGEIVDPRAVRCAELAVEALEPDWIVHGGDLIGCVSFSSHQRASLLESGGESFFEAEIVPARKRIDHSQQHARRGVVMLEGNHEFRVERACAENSMLRSLWDIIAPRHLLSRDSDGARRADFKYIEYTPKPGFTPSNYVQIASEANGSGGLIGCHGWSHAMHAAYAHYQLSKTRSVWFNHVHRKQMFSTRNP